MSGQVEPLTRQLAHRLSDPSSLLILAGVASSSFWFFGNLGMELGGVLKATDCQSERTKKGISEESALKLWAWMYNRGKTYFGGTAVLSSALYLVASTFRPELRPILYGASFLSFLTVPYTLVVLMPINKLILKTANDASKVDAKRPESGFVDKLFGEWRKYHFIRLPIGAVAWGFGMAALLLAN